MNLYASQVLRRRVLLVLVWLAALIVGCSTDPDVDTVTSPTAVTHDDQRGIVAPPPAPTAFTNESVGESSTDQPDMLEDDAALDNEPEAATPAPSESVEARGVVFAKIEDTAYAGPEQSSFGLIVLSDGLVASWGREGVRIWDPTEPAIALGVNKSVPLGPLDVVEASDGTIVASGRGMVHIFDPDTPEVVTTDYRGRQIRRSVELNDGRIASTGRRSVLIWDRADPDTTIDSYDSGSVTEILALADGRIAWGALGGQIFIWNPANPDVFPTKYLGHGGLISELVQTASGTVVSATMDDPRVQIWDPDEPVGPIAVYSGHERGVNTVFELADGRMASGGRKAELHIWDPANPAGQPVIYLGHQTDVDVEAIGVWAIAELPDGRIASTTIDGPIHIWDPSSPNQPAAKWGYTTEAPS